MSLLSDGSALAGVRFGTAVTVRVPATAANLGPGFDSLGLAFDVHDRVVVEAGPASGTPGLDVEVEGEGAGTVGVPMDESHLVVRSLRAGLRRAGAAQPTLRVSCQNRIPHGRGLGSSAAAIVAGLTLARGLLCEPDALPEEAVFDLATAAEGHPDNVAATLFGGFTIAWTDSCPTASGPVPTRAGALSPRARAVRLDVDPRVRAVLCVPSSELATERARAMLPATVPHADAAFNAGRSALLVEALTRSPELLWAATEDRLHQAQRAAAMPATAALLAAVRAAGGAAVVSGAGPSILVLGTAEEPAAAVGAAFAARGEEFGAWQVLTPAIDTVGARLITESDLLA